jgi:hypothetical protein
MKMRSPPGSQFWLAWLASGYDTGSLADTLVRVPLLSRESVAAGPSHVLEFMALLRIELKLGARAFIVLVREAWDFIPGATASCISDIM